MKKHYNYSDTEPFSNGRHCDYCHERIKGKILHLITKEGKSEYYHPDCKRIMNEQVRLNL
jgi:hypothetical protein